MFAEAPKGAYCSLPGDACEQCAISCAYAAIPSIKTVINQGGDMGAFEYRI